jgi:hypothetical protein
MEDLPHQVASSYPFTITDSSDQIVN